MPFNPTTKNSPELSRKVLELSQCLVMTPRKARIKLEEAILSMGPSCFFDDMENEDEAKGAIKALDWILTGLK